MKNKKLYAFSKNSRFIFFQTDEKTIDPYGNILVRREPQYDIEYQSSEVKNSLTVEEINLIQELIEYRKLGESMTFDYRERLGNLQSKTEEYEDEE